MNNDEALINKKEYLENFRVDLHNLKLLNNSKNSNEKLKNILLRQIYISIIGTMETFLWETFTDLTLSKDEYFRNFIMTFPKFQKQKYELSSIFIAYNELKAIAKNEIDKNIRFHNVSVVVPMFEKTFNIDIPSPITREIYHAVTIRHDLVHKNGKTEKGNYHELNEKTISYLIEEVSNFVEEIANKLGIE